MAPQITLCEPTRGEAQINHSTFRQPEHLDLYGDVFELPEFTMKDIYDAIPPHCFKPSISRGLAYVVRDYFYLVVLIHTTHRYTPLIPSAHLRAVIYGLCTILEGMIMTGIWILAHECGHGAFSKSKRLNDSLGFFLHSTLLVPYFSWKITHSHHHKSTGDLQRDTVFVPYEKAEWIKNKLGREPHQLTIEDVSEDAPVVLLIHCVLVQLFGWPLYMLDNLSGQKGQHGFPFYSHYWFGKSSGIFKPSELHLIFISDIGILLTTALLYLGVNTFGWWEMLIFYGVPYLWLNHWIVLITFLQHTDGRLPHFSHNKWTFARGAAATIDRDFGFIDTHLFHNIVGTHVVHHLVSSIPFYHAQEATEAVKKVMGKHYHADLDTPLFSAFWKNRRDCQYVEESSGMEGSGIFMYRNLHGRGVKPSKVGEIQH